MKLRGPWSEVKARAFLAEVQIPLRLACQGQTGFPVLASLWFVPQDGRIWCATQESARTARLLRDDPRCAFEVAPETPPYRGVRGQAEARIDVARGPEILELLIARYLGDDRSDFARWLLSRAESEVAIALEPRSMLSWDFGARMAGAVRSGRAAEGDAEPDSS